MTKRKLFLILALSIILLIGNITPASAIVTNDSVTLEQFDKSMTNLYEKYDLNFEIVDSENYTPITKIEFKSILDETENELMTIVNDFNKNEALAVKMMNRNKLKLDNLITPYLIMPIYYYFSGSYQITGKTGLAHVTINFAAQAVKNAANGYFMELTPFSWYHSSSLNLDSVNYSNKTWYIRNGGRTVYAYATGIAKFSYTVPYVNATIKSEYPFSVLRSYEN